MSQSCLVNLMEEGTRDLVDRSEHIGLNFIAAYLRSNAIDISVIDANFYWYSDQQVIEMLIAEKPKIIGFSLYERMLKRVVMISQAVRAALGDVHITLGGHNASFDAEAILSRFPTIDSVVVGEGEATFLELTSVLLKGQSWQSISGLAYYNGSECVFTPSRILIKNLDDLPFPNRAGPLNGIHTEYLNISASRGCYAQCSFCTTPVFYGFKGTGRRLRARSPKHLLDEIEYLLGLYGPHVKFWFSDDNFTHIKYWDRTWYDTFIAEIRQRRLQFSFAVNSRTDSVTEELFSELKEVGLCSVFLGIESGVQETLDFYRKRVTVDRQKQAVQILHDLGISMRIGWIMYNPYSTLEQLYQNIAFLEEIGYFTLLKQYRYPLSLKGSLSAYPGTPVLRTLQKNGDIPLHRTEYLDWKYEFRESRIPLLQSLLQEWVKAIEPVIERDSLYLMETAKAQSLHEIHDEIVRVSDTFMLLDLRFYRTMLDLVSSEPDPEAVWKAYRIIYPDFASSLRQIDEHLIDFQAALLDTVPAVRP